MVGSRSVVHELPPFLLVSRPLLSECPLQLILVFNSSPSLPLDQALGKQAWIALSEFDAEGPALSIFYY
jgi:hypothetical protein